MSSIVGVIFAAVIFAVINYSTITRVANNYTIRTEPHFLNQTKPNSFQTESEFFLKRTKIVKNLFRTSLPSIQMYRLDSQLRRWCSTVNPFVRRDWNWLNARHRYKWRAPLTVHYQYGCQEQPWLEGLSHAAHIWAARASRQSLREHAPDIRVEPTTSS